MENLGEGAYEQFINALSEKARVSWDNQMKSGFPAVTLPIQEWLIATKSWGDMLDSDIYFAIDDMNPVANSIAIEHPEFFGEEAELVQDIKEDEKAKEEGTPTRKELKKEEDKKKKESVKEGETELLSRFKSEDEKRVYETLKRNIKAEFKETLIRHEFFDDYATLVFSYYRRRSEITGEPLEVVAKTRPIIKTRYGKANTLGFAVSPAFGLKPGTAKELQKRGFLPKEKFDSIGTGLEDIPIRGWALFLKDRADLSTALHELGHGFLMDIALDWEFIHSIPEDQLTEAQTEYKETMEYVEKWLNDQGLRSLLVHERGVFRTHERFATSTEKFFLHGDFQDINTAKLMLRFQKHLTQVGDLRVGGSYITKGGLP